MVGLINFADWLMREAKDGPSTSHPPQPQESNSDSGLFEQVETFEWEEQEIEGPIQLTINKQQIIHSSNEKYTFIHSSNYLNFKI